MTYKLLLYVFCISCVYYLLYLVHINIYTYEHFKTYNEKFKIYVEQNKYVF